MDHRKPSPTVRWHSVALLALAGCATPAPQPFDGPFLTYQHGTAGFGGAMEYARGYCAQAGLKSRHVGTDPLTRYTVLSRFECFK